MNILLQQLTEAVGVSGREKEIRTIIKDHIANHVDQWHVDTMGNLIACKKGTGKSDLKVMLDAHMDEVGLMITEIDTQGTAKFARVGGINEQSLLGKVVQVGADKVVGVIGARPIHLLNTRAEQESPVKFDAMRIDIGATSKDAGNQKMKVGDRATFLTEYQEQGEVAFGKAFDNRCACAILIEILQGEPYPFDLYTVFSVQEELGLRGAQPATFGIQPDIAIVVETTPAHDIANKNDVNPNVALGKGAGIYVMDSRTIQDPRLVRHLMQTADKNGIPFQIRQPGGGGTNTGAVQTTGAGVASATIATPVRYAHSPMGMINLKDFTAARQLVEASLRSLSRDVLQRGID